MAQTEKTSKRARATISLNTLTGKQAAFVNAYLGEARFNASRAAMLAGYRATSKHSFEAIGSENLTKPPVRSVIDEYFKMSRMSSDAVLAELSELARSNATEKGALSAKVRALALLSAHFGLLDGAGANGGRYGPQEPVTLNVVYTNEVTDAIQKVYGREITNEERADRIIEIVQTAGRWHEEAEQFNIEAQKNNARIEKAWDDLLERFKESPEAVEALTLLRNEVHFNCGNDPCVTCKAKTQAGVIAAAGVALQSVITETGMSEAEARKIVAGRFGLSEQEVPVKPEPIEPEIIPPDRRLQPAAVERLMRETDHEPQTYNVPATDVTSEKRERVRPYGFCQRVEPEELERIHDSERALRMF